jgi:hypothetical protein
MTDNTMTRGFDMLPSRQQSPASLGEARRQRSRDAGVNDLVNPGTLSSTRKLTALPVDLESRSTGNAREQTRALVPIG